MSRLRSCLAKLSPRAVLVGAWLVMIVYAYPGQMTLDSIDHLKEARANFFTDGHPPALAYLVRWVERVVAGPFGLLVIQTTTFLVGLYLVFKRVFPEKKAAWWAAGVFLFPPIAVPMAVIWKDCLMAGFLLIGIAALFDERRKVQLLGLLAMFAASAVRYNAFAATLPFVVLFFRWTPEIRGVKRYAIAVAAWLAVTMAAFTLNGALTDRKMHVWHSSLAVHDIVGTLAHVDGTMSDEELLRLFAGTEIKVKRDIHKAIRAVYSPSNYAAIVAEMNPDALWALPVYGTTPAPEAQREAIGRVWWEVITSHPVAYARHRLGVMYEVLSFGKTSPGAVTSREVRYPHLMRELGVGTHPSWLQRGMTKGATWLWKATPLFTPWVYVALALICLGLGFRQRDLLAWYTSGLIMESSLIVLAPSRDFRYSHWLIITTVVATIVLTARRARSGAPASPPGPPDLRPTRRS